MSGVDKMSVVSRHPSVSVQSLSKTSTSIGHIWETRSTVPSTSTSPYIREIHSNAARKAERQHLRTRGSVPASHLSSTLKNRTLPRVRVSGSLSSGFTPGTFSNGASSVSPLSIPTDDGLDLGYQGHISDRMSARRTEVFTVCDVEIQVRPKVSDKTIQATDMAEESLLSTVQKENEEVMEENFRLRRLVDDLKFRLTEVTHEKESLEEDMELLRSVPQHAPSRPDQTSRNTQTDAFEPTSPSSGRRTRNISSSVESSTPASLIEDEKEPPADALLDELVDELETEQLNSAYSGKMQDDVTHHEMTYETEAVKSIFLAHMERDRVLQKVKKQETKNARAVLQAYFSGHMERKRVMCVLREEEI